MNRIITIGREFGSGGREIGKRLADLLQIAYYDKEIVEEIAKRTQLAEDYVHQVTEHRPNLYYPITIGRTLQTHGADYMIKQQTAVFAEKANVLREMAEKSDCIIVGRCADYILRDLSPLRLFAYADMDARMARCRQKAPEAEALTDRQLRRRIREVDRHRARYYLYYTGQTWGARENYDLCINTSTVTPKDAAAMLAHLLD